MHPLGFAYYPDGAHEGMDEVETDSLVVRNPCDLYASGALEFGPANVQMKIYRSRRQRPPPPPPPPTTPGPRIAL